MISNWQTMVKMNSVKLDARIMKNCCTKDNLFFCKVSIVFSVFVLCFYTFRIPRICYLVKIGPE